MHTLLAYQFGIIAMRCNHKYAIYTFIHDAMEMAQTAPLGRPPPSISALSPLSNSSGGTRILTIVPFELLQALATLSGVGVFVFLHGCIFVLIFVFSHFNTLYI